jgi:hypothetical protein
MREPFKQSTGKNRTFSTDQQAYGSDVQPPQKLARLSASLNVYKHDRKFRASGPMKSYIGPFPEYKEDPLKQVKPVKSTEKKDHFKYVVAPKSKPSPSVTLNRTNISRLMH